MGVYLPDCHETLGWDWPGCFATAADSGGLKPDRALMWPYLGLRESPRNLLREAPRGLRARGGLWSLFYFPIIRTSQTPGLGLPLPSGSGRKTWAGGSVGVTGSSFPGPVGTTVSAQCPLGIPGCVQELFVSPVLKLSLREAPAGSRAGTGQGLRGTLVAPRGAGSRWDRASSALEVHRKRSQTAVDRPSTPRARFEGRSSTGGLQPCLGRGLAEPLRPQLLAHAAPLPPAEPRAPPQPEPSPPWTPE
ncbi:hypothetical protein Nmel_018820, partial [Mimus melanotis]